MPQSLTHNTTRPHTALRNAVPTNVEKKFLGARPFAPDGELIPSIEVSNAIELGKLTALRLIEWLCENPEGVISLPTGKSPEYCIQFLTHYKKNWHRKDVQKELRSHGIESPSFPDTSQIKFVQLDEFYPLSDSHRNSFYSFVTQQYLPLLQIRPENALLINAAKINDVDAFCASYEQTIAQWGGIGFFLGGIGPDGHIAFNMFGSAPDSTTRLVTLNYESACAAATSLGGMQYARNKTALTIGMQTITAHPNATIIIIAAGQSKAPLIAQALEHSDPRYPATALQSHPGARFYLTHGATTCLRGRYLKTVSEDPILAHNHAALDRIFINASLAHNKPIHTLTHKELQSTDDGALLSQRECDISLLAQDAHERLAEKIETEPPFNSSIMHTAPHHDDVMLSYHPLAIASLDQNSNHIAYATSGFNAVTNDYLREITDGMDHDWIRQHEAELFGASYRSLLSHFCDAYQARNTEAMRTVEQWIVGHHMRTLYGITQCEQLTKRIGWLRETYLASIAPGEKDCSEVQHLKGVIRETEVDRMWQIHGIEQTHVTHLRSKFYTGDYFTPQPTFTDDVTPMLSLLEKHVPDIVTVAFDPEGTGPDTHYKVLQVVAEALRAWKKNPTIWGYRNVWHRFEPWHATLMYPVSQQELSYLDDIFMHCFSTQKDAAFPSHYHDGPFGELSVRIQKEQLQILKILLGESFFTTHASERVKNAAGFCFIKKNVDRRVSCSKQGIATVYSNGTRVAELRN